MPTMLLSSRQFPSRAEIPNTFSASIPVKPGGLVTLDAPREILVAHAGKPDSHYSFLFWHAFRQLVDQPVLSFTAPGDELNFFATAWYRQDGGAGGPPPPPHVSALAFSLDKDELLADTPIASATPAGVWSGPPSTEVSTAGAAPVVITARRLIDGSGEFVSWLAFGGGTVAGAQLTAAPKTAVLAIGSYGIPQPDPCGLLRSQRDGLEPGDFPTIEAYRRALAAANARLHACERAHGEPLD